MNLVTSVIVLAAFLAAGAYLFFGILHMVLPRRTLSVYRFFLGKRFDSAEAQFGAMSKRSWKILGAAYICFSLFIVWVLMRGLAHALSLH